MGSWRSGGQSPHQGLGAEPLVLLWWDVLVGGGLGPRSGPPKMGPTRIIPLPISYSAK